jgi:hypothetical protein
VNWLELAILFFLARGKRDDEPAGGVPVLQKGASGTLWQVRPVGSNQQIETASGAAVLTFHEQGGQRFLVARAPGASSKDFGAAVLDFKIREETSGVGVLDTTQGNRWWAVLYRHGSSMYWGKPFWADYFSAIQLVPLGSELFGWMGANWAKAWGS